MKKFVVCMMMLAFASNAVVARDYAKLQIKEMKHAQKYGTTQTFLQAGQLSLTPNNPQILGIKDPKIMKIGNYQKIDEKAYNQKLKSDEVKYEEYSKFLGKKASKQYRTQADAEDFYKLYRVAEKIIRANNLGYINWTIEIYKDAQSPNAYTTSTNHVAISTALFDTFADNEDALAMVVGHEMGHALLGHLKRNDKLIARMQRQKLLAKAGNTYAAAAYLALKRKYVIDSKNMEYAADVEGAKLAKKAGYNLNSASEVLTFFETMPRYDSEWRSDHPYPEKRIENLKQNAKYFPEQWKELGEYNIYNSDVLPVKLSSDRKSMVISAGTKTSGNFYKPETPAEIYARFGYMYYVNGEFSKSVEYFNKLFSIDKSNAPAYLYASYASEALYKNTGNKKYLQNAKDYASYALKLDPQNKYMLEQVDTL